MDHVQKKKKEPMADLITERSARLDGLYDEITLFILSTDFLDFIPKRIRKYKSDEATRDKVTDFSYLWRGK